MCGIAGWFCQGEARPSPDIIKNLLRSNMERGISATGLAYQDGQHIRIQKGKGPANEFIETAEAAIVAASASPRGLLHARATTKGSEEQNENNHPVAGYDWAVVHNGMIYNDDDVWSYYAEHDKVSRFADVDTSAIPLMLSRGDTIEQSINNLSILSGTLTLAAWSPKYIDRILLGRFGNNDLYMFYDSGQDILYWSSASSAAFAMPGPTFGRHKFLSFSRLADNHVLVLQPGGFGQTRVFKVERNPFVQPHVTRVHTSTVSGGSKQISYSPSALPAPVGLADKIISLTKSLFSETKKTPGRIEVQLPPADGMRQYTITWSAIETVTGKPEPMSEHFAHSWWNLHRELAQFRTNVRPEVVLPSGYGRWKFSRDDANGIVRTFRPYKRTKDYWDRQYRTRYTLPYVPDTHNKTELDNRFAWEHYDISIQLLDNTTRRYLGFMCPLCGVWTNPIALKTNSQRCEFCSVTHRIYPELAKGHVHGDRR